MAEVREMGWPCCDVIHLLWLQGLSEGWVPPLWLSLHSELVHANYVTKGQGLAGGGGGIKETWACTRWEQNLCFTQQTHVVQYLD